MGGNTTKQTGIYHYDKILDTKFLWENKVNAKSNANDTSTVDRIFPL
jgi:hypothetical protein